jgi:hypothetical protein
LEIKIEPSKICSVIKMSITTSLPHWGMKLKRFRITVDGNQTNCDLNKLFDDLVDDNRLVEYFGLYDRSSENFFFYLEYDHPRRVSTLLNTFKKRVDEDSITIKKMTVNKNKLINSFVKQALIQNELPVYYNKVGVKLHEYF